MRAETIFKHIVMFIVAFVSTASFSLAEADSSGAPPADSPLVATFSIVAFDPATGELGVGVQSKFFGVGSVVPWAEANVGAIATQSYANLSFGPKGLALLRSGKSGRGTLEQITREDSDREFRQIGIVDGQGRVASFTGQKCNGWAGHIEGTNFCVQGNILAGEEVVKAMAAAYEAARQKPGLELADWIMASLQAGQEAGGDKRGQQSAALLVVREKAGVWGQSDRFVDLRVEDHAEPIRELSRLLEIHKQFYRDAHEKKPARNGRSKEPGS